MSTLALIDLFDSLRVDSSEFVTWYATHEVPSTALDAFGRGKGIKAYRRADGAVVTEATDAAGVNTEIGLVEALDATLGVAVTQVRFAFGWREAAKQINYGPGGRIVICPGGDGDALGQEGSAQKVSTQGTGTRANPRSLGTLHELFTVFVWGYNELYPEDEAAQYVAARELYDALYRVLYRDARAGADAAGQYVLNKPVWVTEHTQRRHGCEIKAFGVIQAMHPDHAFTTIKGPPTHPHPTVHIRSTNINPPGPQP